MGYQFVHVEVYARVSPAKAKTRRWTVREVIAEANREPGHHPHVANPRPPALVFGAPLAEVEAAALDAAGKARDASGRKLRKDAPILLAGVASFPVPVDSMGDHERAAYDTWERDTVRWLHRVHGARLKVVVRHEDESAFLHLHFFVVPELEAGERIESVHPGRAAVAAGKQNGVSERRALNRLYRDAMRKLQDDYHAEVGIAHGLTRRGPGRRRLSRAEWLVEQQQARVLAATVRESERATARAAEAADEIVRMALRVAEVEQERRRASRERDDARQRVAQREGELISAETSRRAAEVALSDERRKRSETEATALSERRRADTAERLLAEARRMVSAVVGQATALVRWLFDPLRAPLPSRRPDWLDPAAWGAVRGLAAARVSAPIVPRVGGDRRRFPAERIRDTLGVSEEMARALSRCGRRRCRAVGALLGRGKAGARRVGVEVR